MKAADIPAALRGRVQPTLTIGEVRKWIAYDRALHPARRRVTVDEFDQLVYDAVAANKATDRAQIVAWLRTRFEVIGGRS